MIELNYNQVDFLKNIAIEKYIDEIMDHWESNFPGFILLQKDKDIKSYINQGISIAKKYGYTQRGSVRLYIDMMIMFGVNFERDPLFQWLIEKEKSSQIERSVKSHMLLTGYFEKVYGDNGCFFKESINNFKEFSEKYLPVKIDITNKELHEMLKYIYPQRYDFVGTDAIDNLIFLSESKKYKLKHSRHRSYLVIIMFLFGCSFEQDFFRSRFILEPLMKYLNNEHICNHNTIVSCYESFQVTIPVLKSSQEMIN